MRCDKHGLATADDGQCVLCRREAGNPPRAPSPEGERPDNAWATSLFWVGPNITLLTLVAIMTAVFIASRSLAGLAPTAPLPEPAQRAERDDEGYDAVDALNDRFEQYDRAANLGDDEAEAEHRAAMKRVEVNLYYTNWCNACKTARRWFETHDIDYNGYDIERDSKARHRMRQLNPRGSIPTIEIDGAVVAGFNEQRIQYLLNAAKKKRRAEIARERQ